MEVTIEITQFCENKCNYCSTVASEKGKHLEFNIIRQFLNKQKGVTRINISGGEPLAHPEFYKIYKLCKSITKDVRVYTNLLEHIIFNGNILSEIKIEANIVVIPGTTLLMPKANHIHFLKLQPCGLAKGVRDNTKISCSGKECSSCDHALLQADKQVVTAPCKKSYV